jgi:hypothetical protein
MTIPELIYDPVRYPMVSSKLTRSNIHLLMDRLVSTEFEEHEDLLPEEAVTLEFRTCIM